MNSAPMLPRAYLRAFDELYGGRRAVRSSGEARGGFDRHLLPDPAEYYRGHLKALRIGSGPWAQARCPFHEDRSPSLSVNLEHGGFRCFGCGASGGDVLAFHQRLAGLDFKDAARDLGAWEARP